MRMQIQIRRNPFQGLMNVNNPSHYGNSVIDLLVLEVGSYIIRI